MELIRWTPGTLVRVTVHAVCARTSIASSTKASTIRKQGETLRTMKAATAGAEANPAAERGPDADRINLMTIERRESASVKGGNFCLSSSTALSSLGSIGAA